MISKALALGFSAGIYCLGYCYPIIGPLLMSGQASKKKRAGNASVSGPSAEMLRGPAIAVLLFLAGRLFAYTLFGILTGFLGNILSEIPAIQKVIFPGVFVVLGILMVLFGLASSFPHASLCRLGMRFFQKQTLFFITGFLAGINICPPFLLAMSYTLSLGGVADSVLFFLFYYVATTVFFIPLLFVGFIVRIEHVRIAARICAVLAGLWFVYLGLRILI